MKRNFSRIVVIMLVLSMAILPAAMAAEARASDYIYRTYANVTATGNGNLIIDFNITGTGNMTSIGASKIEVKNSSGTTVRTFSNLLTPSMMGSNTIYYASSVTYSGSSGEYYYAVVTFYAGNSRGGDTDVYTTSSVKA